jgi:peptidyl-prolyl cis-trans isomerase D
LSKPTPLAAVRERVITDIQADRRAIAAKGAADALLARANKGEALETLAAASGSQVQAAAGIERSASTPAHDVIATAFRLPRPKSGQTHAGLAKLAADRYALVEVSRVEDGNPRTMDAATRGSLRKQYARARAEVEARAYVDMLRKRFPVQIAADRL